MTIWDGPLGGVVVGALLSMCSGLVLWWFTTRRDDHFRARTIRREVGVEAIRRAYRLRYAANKLLAIDSTIASGQTVPEGYPDQVAIRHAWEEASRAVSEQLHVVAALGVRDVWRALRDISDHDERFMDGLMLGEGQEFSYHVRFDVLIAILARAVRADAGVDIGTEADDVPPGRRNALPYWV